MSSEPRWVRSRMSGGPLLDDDGALAEINHKGGPGEARDFGLHVSALIVG